jgi:hypothetical protein
VCLDSSAAAGQPWATPQGQMTESALPAAAAPPAPRLAYGAAMRAARRAATEEQLAGLPVRRRPASRARSPCSPALALHLQHSIYLSLVHSRWTFLLMLAGYCLHTRRAACYRRRLRPVALARRGASVTQMGWWRCCGGGGVERGGGGGDRVSVGAGAAVLLPGGGVAVRDPPRRVRARAGTSAPRAYTHTQHATASHSRTQRRCRRHLSYDRYVFPPAGTPVGNHHCSTTTATLFSPPPPHYHHCTSTTTTTPLPPPPHCHYHHHPTPLHYHHHLTTTTPRVDSACPFPASLPTHTSSPVDSRSLPASSASLRSFASVARPPRPPPPLPRTPARVRRAGILDSAGCADAGSDGSAEELRAAEGYAGLFVRRLAADPDPPRVCGATPAACA